MDIQRLSDESAIRDITARFTDAVNRRDAKTLGALFTVDGEWHVPGMPVTVGPAAATERINGLLSTFVHLMQLIHSGHVDIDGNHATGVWYLSEIAGDADGNSFEFSGVYQDELVRSADGWRFAKRTWSFLYRGKAGRTGKWYPHPGAADR